MGRRLQARKSNGRWERGTLENTFGLRCEVCPVPECRNLNPYGRDPENPFAWERPTHCHACGAEMPETD